MELGLKSFLLVILKLIYKKIDWVCNCVCDWERQGSVYWQDCLFFTGAQCEVQLVVLVKPRRSLKLSSVTLRLTFSNYLMHLVYLSPGIDLESFVSIKVKYNINETNSLYPGKSKFTISMHVWKAVSTCRWTTDEMILPCFTAYVTVSVFQYELRDKYTNNYIQY